MLFITAGVQIQKAYAPILQTIRAPVVKTRSLDTGRCPKFLVTLQCVCGLNLWFALSASSTPGTYFATLIGSIVVYRVSPFHPLAEYPGLFITKISKLRMVDSSLRLLRVIPGLMNIRGYSFAQLGNHPNTMHTCTRNAEISCTQVDCFPLHLVLWYLRVLGLLEAIVERGQVDLSEMFGFCVSLVFCALGPHIDYFSNRMPLKIALQIISTNISYL